MKKLATAKTTVTASQTAWTMMFCCSILERLSTYDLEKTLRAIGAYFNHDVTKRSS